MPVLRKLFGSVAARAGVGSRTEPGTAQPLEPSSSEDATIDDIRACFRLILGRSPGEQEWPGHTQLAGRPLVDVVRGYLNSQEFHNRRLLEYNFGDIGVGQFNGFKIHGDAADPEVGAAVLSGSYEPHVAAAFEKLLAHGDYVVDVGANIGFFSLLAAHLVGPSGSVLAIEPNPRNARLLEMSRRANGFENITILQVAASDRLGLLALYSGGSNGTTAPTPESGADLLSATSVAALPLDRLVDTDRKVSLIKLDVEGAEGLALRGAGALLSRDRPHVVSEFNPDAIWQCSGMTPQEYLGLLTGQGYSIGVITDAGIGLCGRDHSKVLAAFAGSGVDHIDILLSPVERLSVWSE